MTVSYSALDAVSAALYTTLNVAGLLAVAPGGVSDDVGQATSFPYVLYEVKEEAAGGFGTKPGVGQLPMIDLRVTVFSQYQGMKTPQVVMNKVLELLADPPAVSGYASHAIFHDRTEDAGDQLIGAVKCKSLMAMFRWFVELQ